MPNDQSTHSSAATGGLGSGASTQEAIAHHRGDIDGLRALAVGAVVAFHADVPGFAAGFVGVDVFFVISGFLIMTLLLREVEREGRINLAEFWGRRIRRLAPAMLLVVLVTAVATWVVGSPLRWRSVAVDGLWSSLYVSNMSFAFGTRGYFGGASSPLLHTWSLSVEEQYYIAWPIAMAMIIWVARRIRCPLQPVLAAVVGGGVAASLALSVLLSYRGTRLAYFGLPTRWWEIGLGIGAAIVATRWRPSRRVALAAGFVGAAGLAGAMILISSLTPYPGFAAALPTVATALLLLAGPATPVGQALATPSFQWIGRHSYSWYLWHWPAIMVATGAFRDESVTLKVVAAAGALVLAVATNRFVERPVRFHPALVASPVRSILVGVGGVVVVALVALGLARLQQRDMRDPLLWSLQRATEGRQADEETCSSPEQSSRQCGEERPVLMVVGDSHAAHWAPAFLEAGRRLRITVVVRTRGGCPYWGFEVMATGSDSASAVCSQFVDDTTAMIEDLRPDAIAIASGDYMGRILDGDRPAGSAAEEVAVMESAITSRLEFLKERSGGVVVVLDNAYVPFDPIECLAVERRADDCTFRRDVGLDPVETARSVEVAVARRLGADVFDAANGMCSDSECQTLIDRTAVYSDRTHLTREFVLTQVDDLEAAISGILTSRSDEPR